MHDAGPAAHAAAPCWTQQPLPWTSEQPGWSSLSTATHWLDALHTHTPLCMHVSTYPHRVLLLGALGLAWQGSLQSCMWRGVVQSAFPQPPPCPGTVPTP